MTDSGAKREQNPHYGLYNGLRQAMITFLMAYLRLYHPPTTFSL